MGLDQVIYDGDQQVALDCVLKLLLDLAVLRESGTIRIRGL
jgi:hypothetical protein